MPGKGEAQKDDNAAYSWAGISCVDGKSVVKIQFTSQHKMLIDTTTVISVVPKAISNNDENDHPVIKGVSSTNPHVILPFYVNPANGAVLAQF